MTERVQLPETNCSPEINITRASHIGLTVSDLSRSINFYENVVGLVVSTRTDSAAYLRGVEEDAHHSLVLRQDDGVRRCVYLGYRVEDEDHIARAERLFSRLGVEHERVDVPEQGASLRVRDPAGVPMELCASMTICPRLHSNIAMHKGAPALRYDHVQVQLPNVFEAVSFYTELGFRISDCSYAPNGKLFSAFLHRKNNPHDLVLASRRGPRMHHFGYVVDAQNLMRAGDIAANLGYRRNVEYGPSRHGQDHASFIYMRDPDGHRIELLSHPIQIIDLESTPFCRDVTDRDQFVPWGPSAPAAYVEEASTFPDTQMSDSVIERTW